MPLYESVLQEKPPIVLDIGHAYTKFGFAAEAHPRKIIPTEINLSKENKFQRLLEFENPTNLYDLAVDFLQMIFFKHLLVSPKERKIVIVENIFGRTIIRETLARVLFMHFDIASILFVPSHMIALSSLSLPTAIVIDIGYNEATVMPIYGGIQIMQSFKDQSYGGFAVHKEIERQLINAGIAKSLLTEKILEDIKIRACFVTTLDRAQAYRNGKQSDPDKQPPNVAYNISDEDTIIVPGSLRETAFEVMFDMNGERDSLPDLILRAILQCAVDTRRALIENVIVIGGGAMMVGLMARLQEELIYLLKNDKYYLSHFNTISKFKFKFHKTIGKQNFTAWLGGSVCGSTDLIQTRSLTKDSYIKTFHVPDWNILTENRMMG